MRICSFSYKKIFDIAVRAICKQVRWNRQIYKELLRRVVGDVLAHKKSNGLDNRTLGGIAVVVIVVIAAIVLIGFGTYGNANNSTSVAASSSSTASTTSIANTGQLFAESQFYSYAYQIYPGPLSQDAQYAVEDMTLTNQTLSNGDVNVTIAPSGPAASVSIMLHPGEKLYFTDLTFADENPAADYNLQDDGYVVVDQNGYIVMNGTVQS